MPRRSRETLTYSKIGQHELIDLTSGVTLSSSQTHCVFSDYQRTDSIGHPWKRGAKWKKMNIAAHLIADMGGNFETRKMTHRHDDVHFTLERVTGGYLRKYTGPMFAYAPQRQGKVSDTLEPSSDAQMDAFGATAISRCIPTNPLSGIGQFAAELRQLPTTSKLADWKKTAKDLRAFNAGGILKRGSDDWLNFWFGWAPFAKDVKEFFETARDADKHIAQFERDSGKGIRRKFGFTPVETTTVTDMGLSYGAPSLDSYLIVGPGRLRKTVKTTTHRWFSGSFTYYLPKQAGYKSFDAYAHKLYGLRLDIDLIWKIAPWTWALDWVNNFGDVVRNVAAFSHDGLVMRYGYIMESTTIETTYSLTGLNLYGVGLVNLEQQFVSSTKKRRKATPYGFGLDPGTLSPKQWSIIAALGISKAPRSFNF